MDVTEFVDLIRSRHPEIALEIDLLDCEPNATLACGALRRLLQRAIDEGDRDTTKSCFATALLGWDAGNDRVQNSIGLSLIGKLNFRDQRCERSWAWELLHPRIRAVFESTQPPPSKS